MMNFKTLIIPLLALLAIPVSAQNPTPAPAQSGKIVISGATIHIGNGEVLENGEIRIVDGKIERVGGPTRALLNDYEKIDASGQHIFPGLIALNTTLGLVEIQAVRSTNDRTEVGTYNPNVRSLIAFNTDSQIIPTVRSRGVLLAQATPRGGLISGQSSVFQLDGWNYEDAVIAVDEGMHLNWPRRRSYNWQAARWGNNENYPEQIRDFENFIAQAAAYCEREVEEVQLRYAAMCSALQGEAQIYVHVDLAADILAAIEMFKAYDKVQLAIIGGAESHLVAPQLAAANIPVILGSTQALPRREDDPIDLPFRLPALLEEAGVEFALNHGPRWGGWQQRNLPFQAGQAVAYGLDYERAIQALTLVPAQILGIDEQYGSLEAGKSATLIVVDGDLLDSRSSRITQAYIDGRNINLDNKQEYLARKFRSKYEE